jgi:hypothetical protein
MGFWDSVKKVGTSVIAAPFTGAAGAIGAATGALGSGAKSFINDPLDINYRKRKNEEAQQQQATAAQQHRDQLSTGYDTYRQNLAQGQDTYNRTMGGYDTQSKESMDKYRIDRNALDSQADNTRQTLMGMERNLVGEATQNVNNITNKFVGTAENLSNEARNQANDAKQTYTGTVKPNLMNNLNDAQNFQKNISGQAMSLAEAMDANNKVAQGQRELYGGLADQMTGRYQQMSDQERADLEGLMGRGAGLYQGEIDSTHKRGLADVGVLSALGAQSTNLLGGGANPMTGSQMQALMAQQGSQASEAFANTQQRMKNLEDQRRAYQLSSLQTMGDRASDLRRGSLAQEGLLRGSGIEAGREESQAMYDRGYQGQTEAMDRTAKRLADLMGGETDYNRLAQSLRGEQSGYAGDIYGAKSSAEQFRQSGADRLFGSQAGFEEGKIARGYGNTAEDMSLRDRALGIDRAATDRGFAFDQNLNSLDYQRTREDAGLGQSAVANNIQMQQAQQQQNMSNLMGMLGIGAQVLPAVAGAPGGAPAPRQVYNPYQRQYPTTMNMGNPYGSMNA